MGKPCSNITNISHYETCLERWIPDPWSTQNCAHIDTRQPVVQNYVKNCPSYIFPYFSNIKNERCLSTYVFFKSLIIMCKIRVKICVKTSHLSDGSCIKYVYTCSSNVMHKPSFPCLWLASYFLHSIYLT